VTIRHLFDTEAEAKAFEIGVEYVNDSAISVDEVYNLSDGSWVVVVSDEDADEDYESDHRAAAA
jgi:hypothetical protein